MKVIKHASFGKPLVPEHFPAGSWFYYKPVTQHRNGFVLYYLIEWKRNRFCDPLYPVVAAISADGISMPEMKQLERDRFYRVDPSTITLEFTLNDG